MGEAQAIDAPVGARVAGTADHSLRSGTLTMPEVLAQSVANMAPSAAMALLPLLVFGSALNGTWVSFVVAIILMLCVGYCAAQFGRRINSAGSFYVWVTRALGPGFGHAAGWGLELGYIATAIATAYGFAIFAGDFLTRAGLAGDNWTVVTILLIADVVLATAVAVMDMNLSARMSLILEGLSVTIITVLCIATWIHQGGVIDTSQLSLKGVTGPGVVVGVVLAIFAFVGFESAGSLGVESKDSFRNIPRAILWSCFLVGIFYLIVSYTQVFAFQGAHTNTAAGLAVSGAPLPDMAAKTGIGIFAYAIDIGIVCSMFACTLACINAGARVLYSMTQDGMGHRSIGNVHARRRTPHIAIYIVAAVTVAVPIFTQIIKTSPVTATGWVGSVAVYGFMLAYALICVGAPLMLRRAGVSSPITWGLGIVGALVMLFVFWANWIPQTIPGGAFPSLTAGYQYLPYVFLAWTVLGAAYYLYWRSRNPDKVKDIGSNYHTPDGPAASKAS